MTLPALLYTAMVMVTPEEEAQIAHRAWYAAMGGTGRDGSPLFPWHQLTGAARRDWQAAATGALTQATRAAAAAAPAPGAGSTAA